MAFSGSGTVSGAGRETEAHTSGEAPKSSIDMLLDAHFDDARMERIYPNAKKVAKAG